MFVDDTISWTTAKNKPLNKNGQENTFNLALEKMMMRYMQNVEINTVKKHNFFITKPKILM